MSQLGGFCINLLKPFALLSLLGVVLLVLSMNILEPLLRPHEDERFQSLGQHLRKGHLVAFPTETVWVAPRTDQG